MTKAKLLHDIKVLKSYNVDIPRWVDALAHCSIYCSYYSAIDSFAWDNDLNYWRTLEMRMGISKELTNYSYADAPSTQAVVVPLLKEIYLDTHPEYFI